MPRKYIRRFLDDRFGNPWDRFLRRARQRNSRRLLIFWNRGLGDIALGLYQIIVELRQCLPHAEIVVLTRADLADCFQLLPVDRVVIDPALKREEGSSTLRAKHHVQASRNAYDLVLTRIDPTRWFRQKPKCQPRLAWPEHLDGLCARFDRQFEAVGPGELCIGIHVSSETATFYKYEKDWPTECWRALIIQIGALRPCRFILFGLASSTGLDMANCIDLRGQTSLLEMLALIKNRCRILIAPDSGVLTMTYYLDVQVALGVVSLWSDPRQGVLKQGTASPNALLRHLALIGDSEEVARIAVGDVVAAVESLLGTEPTSISCSVDDD